MFSKIGYKIEDLEKELKSENLKYCLQHFEEYNKEEQSIISELLVVSLKNKKGGE